MSLFRSKSRKPRVKDFRVTLDAKHRQFTNHFTELQKSVPSKKKELEKLEKEFSKISKIPNKKLSNEDLEKKFELKDNISTLSKEIDDIVNNSEMNDYYLNAGHYVYKYYDNLNTVANKKEPSIVDFFSKKSSPKKSPKKSKSPKNKKMSDFVKTTDNFKRADILNSYLKTVESNYVGVIKYDNSYDKCGTCNAEMTIVQSEGIIVCNNCGTFNFIIIESDKRAYKDHGAVENVSFSYKRLNHLNECRVLNDNFLLKIYSKYQTSFLLV